LASREDGKKWTAQEYTPSHGADLYRRTMYTFWKRTSPPPTLSTFDAPDRETCTVRRARTNTPLQALILMNDPTYVEASRLFAERIVRDGGPSTRERIIFAFRQVATRAPRDREIEILERIVANQLRAYQARPMEAEKLLAVGEARHDRSLAAPEVAAWSVIANLLFNLDEAITRN
jgi:hypothetical protein